MRNAIPIKHFLLLLRPDAVVLVHEIQKRTLGFFEGGIGTGLEVAQVGEYAFFELLRVLDGSSESLESERQTSYNVGTRNVEEIVPLHC